jgi:hypothetical protein
MDGNASTSLVRPAECGRVRDTEVAVVFRFSPFGESISNRSEPTGVDVEVVRDRVVVLGAAGPKNVKADEREKTTDADDRSDIDRRRTSGSAVYLRPKGSAASLVKAQLHNVSQQRQSHHLCRNRL